MKRNHDFFRIVLRDKREELIYAETIMDAMMIFTSRSMVHPKQVAGVFLFTPQEPSDFIKMDKAREKVAKN